MPPKLAVGFLVVFGAGLLFGTNVMLATLAYPAIHMLFTGLLLFLLFYAKAGGTNPVLLIHDQPHGVELISYLSRHGRGLPANVLPFAVNEVRQLGVEVLAGVLAKGTAQILVLVPPRRADELAGLEAQVVIVNTIMNGLRFGAERIEIVLEDDPEAMGGRLEALDVREPP